MAGVVQPPVADSVRLALPAESAQIAVIQRRYWAQVLPENAPDSLLRELDADAMTEVWHRAITRPPAARFRVMVAIEGHQVVGFATTTPSDDPDADEQADGQIDEFVIDPPAQRRGHGSRLMHACVDTLRADGFSRARHWLASTDDVAREFFTTAGWAPDGGHRELGTEDEAVRLKQIRLHTDIAAD